MDGKSVNNFLPRPRAMGPIQFLFSSSKRATYPIEAKKINGTEIRNLLERITRPQSGFGKENGLPWFFLVLKEENPETIIRDEQFPTFAS